MSFEHLHEIARNSLKQQNLQKIKSNASNLDDVLTFRVNSALKKEFSKICKDNQSSASSELKRYMLKIVEQGSFIILNAQWLRCELNYWANLTI